MGGIPPIVYNSKLAKPPDLLKPIQGNVILTADDQFAVLLNRTDEPSLTVFPAYYFPSDASCEQWEMVVEGLLTRPGRENIRSRWSISLMGKVMGVSKAELDTPTFQSRVAPFLANGIKKTEISIKVGQQFFTLPRKTNRAGIFRGRLFFSAVQLCQLLQLDRDPNQAAGLTLLASGYQIPIEVRCPGVEVANFTQIARPIAPAGLSIISDIDDTIKDSQVAPLRALLANTFLNEFRSIEGMADLYRDWEKKTAAEFHYVSSSPWQLFQPIADLCRGDGFPDGTFHLRAFRLSRDLFQKMLIFRRRGKFVVINSLLARFPKRKFILVGDSGERDPEIYRKLAARFPEQVIGVFIRNTEHRQMTEKRMTKLNANESGVSCQHFHTAKQLCDMAWSLINDR